MKLSEVGDIAGSGASFFREPEAFKTFNNASCPVFPTEMDHGVIGKARAGFNSRKVKANLFPKAALRSHSKKLNASTEEVGRSLLRLAALVRDSGDAISSVISRTGSSPGTAARKRCTATPRRKPWA